MNPKELAKLKMLCKVDGFKTPLEMVSWCGEAKRAFPKLIAHIDALEAQNAERVKSWKVNEAADAACIAELAEKCDALEKDLRLANGFMGHQNRPFASAAIIAKGTPTYHLHCHNCRMDITDPAWIAENKCPVCGACSDHEELGECITVVEHSTPVSSKMAQAENHVADTGKMVYCTACTNGERDDGYGGTVECSVCKGDGVVEPVCETCGGDGQIATCSACGWTGNSPRDIKEEYEKRADGTQAEPVIRCVCPKCADGLDDLESIVMFEVHWADPCPDCQPTEALRALGESIKTEMDNRPAPTLEQLEQAAKNAPEQCTRCKGEGCPDCQPKRVLQYLCEKCATVTNFDPCPICAEFNVPMEAE